jgi:hypothetical protein
MIITGRLKEDKDPVVAVARAAGPLNRAEAVHGPLRPHVPLRGSYGDARLRNRVKDDAIPRRLDRSKIERRERPQGRAQVNNGIKSLRWGA